MKKRLGGGRDLLLPELIIVIGFFAVFSAVCVKLFVSARDMSEQSSVLGNAVIAAQDAAEHFKAKEPEAAFYDAQWTPCGENEAVYSVSSRHSAENQVETAKISVIDQEGRELFTLTAKRPEVEK